MKLRDFYKSMPEPLILKEIFDSSIETIWKTNAESLETTISINNMVYKVQLRSYRIQKQIGFSISFNKINDDGEVISSLTNDNLHTSKIIGIIYNAIISEFKKYKMDFIVFVATDNIEKRMRIYNYLTHLMMKSFSNYHLYESLKYKNIMYTLVIKDGIDYKSFSEAVKDELLHLY